MSSGSGGPSSIGGNRTLPCSVSAQIGQRLVHGGGGANPWHAGLGAQRPADQAAERGRDAWTRRADALHGALRVALHAVQPGPARIGRRQRPALREQGIQGGAEPTDVVGRGGLRTGHRERHRGPSVRGDPDPLRMAAAQDEALPVGQLGRLRQRLDHRHRRGGPHHAIGDLLGEAAAGHPFRDGQSEHLGRQVGRAATDHIEQPRGARVLEMPRPLRPGEQLVGPLGDG